MPGFSVRVNPEDLRKMGPLAEELRRVANLCEELNLWVWGRPFCDTLAHTAGYLERCREQYRKEDKK